MTVVVRTKEKQSKYDELIESVVKKLKDLIQEKLATGADAIIQKVIEGEEEMGESRSVCWIVPGPDTIEHSGMRNLAHNFTIYIVYLSNEVQSKNTMRTLRNIAGHGYDVIMEDITLNGLVEKIIPRVVFPGFMKFGDTIYVGVLQTWVALVREGFEV